MSVLNVFGQNLRLLAKKRGTFAGVAQDLDISKIQFQRYMRGDSFPKPHTLKLICTYFNVDARILTEPLSDALLYAMRTDAAASEACDPAMTAAMAFACPTQDYFQDPKVLPDGFYRVVRKSLTFPNCYVNLLFLVKTIGKARVMRCYDDKRISNDPMPAPMRQYRGMVLGHGDGVSIVVFHSPPAMSISHIFVAPFFHTSGIRALTGFSTSGRAELVGRPRIVRIYIEPIIGGFSGAMAYRRRKAFMTPQEVDPMILGIIEQPLN
ncbi:helix-turn-helix domain-containing protein [Pseudorhodobacter sp. W20_MBD10_FR17]|uniref:helix-turn-helix domain-containing protein n=1 Tax=Pseudorhodobacter sp. W20_MBD10_FR17 TaxID=3240266 RepID=UPI003F9C02CF